MTVPASFGDVTGEYLALRRAAALVPATHDVVWVRGPDTVRFLEGLLSQEVGPLDVGSVARSLLLSPQGKLRAVLRLLRSEHGIGIATDRGIGATVFEDLARFKIRVDATIEQASEPLSSLIGPDAVRVLAAAGIDTPGAGRWTGSGAGVVADAPFLTAGLPRFLLGAEVAAALTEAGTTRAGELAATTIRIECGEPAMGRDIDERTIPQEAGVVEGAVSFTKGCYLGQELVARIDARGHVNRHLRGLVVTTNVLPPAGAEVERDGAAVGTITSVGESLDLRAPVAIALIRREVAPSTEVVIRWDGGQAGAVVCELPLIP